MPHPSNQFPKNLVILSGSNAYTDDIVFALHNPSSGEITATVKGAIKTYDSEYAADDTTNDIAIQPGGILYGRFSSVQGAGLIAYY